MDRRVIFKKRIWITSEKYSATDIPIFFLYSYLEIILKRLALLKFGIHFPVAKILFF